MRQVLGMLGDDWCAFYKKILKKHYVQNASKQMLNANVIRNDLHDFIKGASSLYYS